MKVLNPIQEEQLREIAMHLKQMRQKQAISIEEVADKTHIRLRMLQALEAVQINQLPEPVYVQGFIRRYGDFLGIDGNALAQNFAVDWQPVDFDVTNFISDEKGQIKGPMPMQSNYDSPVADQQVAERVEISTPTAPKGKTMPGYIAAAILVGLAAAGVLLYFLGKPRVVESVAQQQKSSLTKSETTTPQLTPSLPVASTPTPKASPTSSPTPLTNQASPTPTTATENQSEATPSPEALSTSAPLADNSSIPTPSPEVQSTSAPLADNSSIPTPSPEALLTQPSPSTDPLATNPITSPIQVAVDLQDDSWVRIKADGKIVFEGILSKGTKQSWTAEKQLTVRSGNAGAVLISVNQQQAQPLGNPGAVKELTITPQQ